jgi:Cu+-exporting ATPase
VRFLAQPDVGFATGTGTEVAIEASDVTLIKGSVMCIITAIEISRATMRDNAQCAPELGRRVWLQRAWHSGARWASCIRLFGILMSPLIAAAAWLSAR